MRTAYALIPLAFAAAPALAAPPAAPPPQADIQRVLNDPAVAERLANTMQALSKAMAELPVGEIEAAVEGREPTPADRNRRLRDVEPGMEAQLAEAKPMIRQSMKALSAALPAMMKGLQEAQKSLERAAANMPDPTYPKR